MLYEILQWTALALAVSLAAASIWILANHIGWMRGFREGIELERDLQENGNGYQQQAKQQGTIDINSPNYKEGYSRGWFDGHSVRTR